MSSIRTQIQQLPKADLHNHLHLGIGIEFLHEKYPEAALKIPKHYDGLDGMIDFIQSKVNSLLNSAEDATYFMDRSIQSAISDNVHYLEASVDMNLVRYFNNSIQLFIKTVAKLKDKYRDQITFKPDIGINKELPKEQVYSDGIACIESGVFHGIDLYGREHQKDLSPFVEIYELAAQNGLKKKVHIGEFSSPVTIDKAIDLLAPDEIQHGIKAVDSEKTIKKLLDNGIRLNVCPQSNISLNAVPSLADHPIRKLYDSGIEISINSDDYLLFNASVTDQCVALIEQGIFSYEEIEMLLKASLPD